MITRYPASISPDLNFGPAKRAAWLRRLKIGGKDQSSRERNDDYSWIGSQILCRCDGEARGYQPDYHLAKVGVDVGLVCSKCLASMMGASEMQLLPELDMPECDHCGASQEYWRKG